MSGGFVIFVDVDGVEHAVELTPDATVADVMAELPLQYEQEGIVYANRLLSPDELLSDAGICAESRVTLSPYISVHHLMLSVFVRTYDFDLKIRKMHDIFPIGSLWRFKNILSSGFEGVADISGQFFNGPSFMVEDIQRGFACAPADEVVVEFRDRNNPQIINIWLFDVEPYMCGYDTSMERWVINSENATIMRVS